MANDQSMVEQERRLSAHTIEEYESLLDLCKTAETEGRYSPAFSLLWEKVYKMGLVFPFDWPGWEPAKRAANDEAYDYTCHTPLELSMHLTTLFRADRFMEGTLEVALNNKILRKIFEAFIQKTNLN